jgi:hypothetical protein
MFLYYQGYLAPNNSGVTIRHSCGAEEWTAALRSWTGETTNPFKTELIAAPAHYFLVIGTPGPRLSALRDLK